MKKMVGKGIKPLLYDCDTELCKLVENLMELNPSKRITAKQALKHSAFKTSWLYNIDEIYLFQTFKILFWEK